VPHFAPHEASGLVPARVIAESRELYRLATVAGELVAGEFWGEITGALRYRAESREDLPAVGDWVACLAPPPSASPTRGGERGVIPAILPRKSRLARRAPGRETEIQLLAANVDTAFLVTSANQDFSPRRLERYLTAVWEGGVEAVVILSKTDLVAELRPFLRELAAVAPGVPVHPLSALSGTGLAALRPHLAPGRTVALLGSSGVGKSTLINRLAGRNLQAVREIREGDGRGRHTTTRRELFALPPESLGAGALLLDTPGMRELGLWGEEGTSSAAVFDDIAELGQGCRFRDCQHRDEPGCAVRAAVEAGHLDPDRLENFHKLGREETWLADRLEKGASYAEKKKWRTLMGEVLSRQP